jgi:hypothetical protein
MCHGNRNGPQMKMKTRTTKKNKMDSNKKMGRKEMKAGNKKKGMKKY